MRNRLGRNSPEQPVPFMWRMTCEEVEEECGRLYALRGTAAASEIRKRHAMRKWLDWPDQRDGYDMRKMGFQRPMNFEKRAIIDIQETFCFSSGFRWPLFSLGARNTLHLQRRRRLASNTCRAPSSLTIVST
jgi:hypothetical protein